MKPSFKSFSKPRILPTPQEVDALESDLRLWSNEAKRNVTEKDSRESATISILEAFKLNLRNLNLEDHCLTSLPPHLLQFSQLNYVNLIGNETLLNEEGQIKLYMNSEYKTYKNEGYLNRKCIDYNHNNNKTSNKIALNLLDLDGDGDGTLNYFTEFDINIYQDELESNILVNNILSEAKVSKHEDIISIISILNNSENEQKAIKHLKSIQITDSETDKKRNFSTKELNILLSDDFIEEILSSKSDNGSINPTLNAEIMREIINKPATSIFCSLRGSSNLFKSNNKTHPEERSAT